MLVGCGSCLEGSTVVQIALCFGVTVATLAQTLGHVSGCHVNPAVTAGLVTGAKVRTNSSLSLTCYLQVGLLKGLLYVVAQCIGATSGAGILSFLIPADEAETGVGVTAISKISAGQGFGVEFIITMVLVLVVFAAAADSNNSESVKGSAPLAIGLSITTSHLFAIPLTGSSMNPARTFGPSLVFSAWDNHWVYWAGPILGGVTAALIYQLLLKVTLGHCLIDLILQFRPQRSTKKLQLTTSRERLSSLKIPHLIPIPPCRPSAGPNVV